MIYICGAPGTGKSSLARQLAKSNDCSIVISTDTYLPEPHETRPQRVLEAVDRYSGDWLIIVEGCEVDRLIKHGLIPEGSLLLCTGFKSTRAGCEGLAARCKKYFNAYTGPKYLVEWK